MSKTGLRRLWFDRDTMGHSVAWAVQRIPGLCVRQTSFSSPWQFDLYVDHMDHLERGWDWYHRVYNLLDQETRKPGYLEMNQCPEHLREAVEVFRKLHRQCFATRKEALQALDAALLETGLKV